jgi:hypothetical protein
MSSQIPSQPRYSPDRLWYWNGREWTATPGGRARAASLPAASSPAWLLVAVGVAIAAGVEVFAWSLPATAQQLMVRQAATDPAAGAGPVAIVAWGFLVALLALAGLANWLVWRGARRGQ